jgi:hypothetical protein
LNHTGTITFMNFRVTNDLARTVQKTHACNKDSNASLTASVNDNQRQTGLTA